MKPSQYSKRGTPLKNPKQRAALLARRARQSEQGPLAMLEYVRAEQAVRQRTRRLREERLAREAAQASLHNEA